MERFKSRWLRLPIEQKARSFVLLLTVGIAAIFICNTFIINQSLTILGGMAGDSSACSLASKALENEVTAFSGYVRVSSPDNRATLDRACEETMDALNALPSDYQDIGPERYARTWRVWNMFGEYVSARNRILDQADVGNEDITLLYEVYEMQDDLERYLQDLVQITVTESAGRYRLQESFYRFIPYILAVMALAMVIFTTAGSKLLTDSLVRPLKKLYNSVRRMSDNDFSGEDLAVENQDEMGELVQAFNQMRAVTARHFQTLEENRVLTEELHREEVQRMETEKQLDVARLDLLQSQMDPHFLFNILNTISGMAELEEAETTDRMIRSLSSIFRYNLQTTAQFVALSRELKVVRDYMYLQQMRFGDRVSYEEVIDPACDLDKAEVPALILQPLVENALIHGLSLSLTGGKVRICIGRMEKADRCFLSISVEDTGQGMDEDALKKLREILASGVRAGRTSEAGERRVGIGLGNVAWRIRTTYPDGDITIDSKAGEGTCVRLLIPEEIT